MRDQPLHFPKLLYVFLLAYLIALISLLDYQSLWLDEIIQLIGTRDGDVRQIDDLTRTSVGGVPFGWLVQIFSIQLLGYSVSVARLASALAAVGTCWVVFMTARDIQLRYPLIPALLLSVLPLHFRYALEGRPYALGILLTALATLIFIRLAHRPTALGYGLYIAVLVLGIYTQPFTSFIACGHLVWALLQQRRQLFYFSASALLILTMAFLPWYLYAKPLWQQAIQADGFHLHLTWKSPLMLLREITGAGYAGGVIVLGLATVGYLKGTVNDSIKKLLLFCILVPVICVLAMDAIFSYFLAIRQLIFILPPLLLLAAEGVTVLFHSSQRRITFATTTLAIALIGADILWLQKPREDWALAAQSIAQRNRDHAACTLFAPDSAASFYFFFQPELRSNVCPEELPNRSVVLAVSPYASEAERDLAEEKLRHWKGDGAQTIGMSTIQVFKQSR